MKIARFMASAPGRLMRVVLGVALVVAGIVIAEPTGWALAAVRLVPIAAGAANVCFFGPLVGAPFRRSALCQ